MLDVSAAKPGLLDYDDLLGSNILKFDDIAFRIGDIP